MIKKEKFRKVVEWGVMKDKASLSNVILGFFFIALMVQWCFVEGSERSLFYVFSFLSSICLVFIGIVLVGDNLMERKVYWEKIK